MKFLSIHENFLKNNLNNPKKDECIVNLTKQIENLETSMYEELNHGYLNVINKCNQLEFLTKRIEEIKEITSEFIKTTQEIVLRTASVSEEGEVVKRSIERLSEIKREFTFIRDFLMMGNGGASENSDRIIEKNDVNTELVRFDTGKNGSLTSSYYKTVQNLKFMERMLGYLKKYNFYTSLNTIYRNYYNVFIDEIKKSISDWIRHIDFYAIGKRLVNINFKFQIFDDISRIRKEIINKKFLKIYYASKELQLGATVVERINCEREILVNIDGKVKRYHESTIDAAHTTSKHDSTKRGGYSLNDNVSKLSIMSTPKPEPTKDNTQGYISRSLGGVSKSILDNNDSVSEGFFYLTGNIVLSHCLIEFFPDCKSFFDEIFDQIDQFNFDDYDIIKSTIIPLKQLITLLNADTEKLDEIIGKVAYKYLERRRSNDAGIDYLKSYIDDAIHFLSQITQVSNELDELLVQRIDNLLVDYYAESIQDRSIKSNRDDEVNTHTSSIFKDVSDHSISPDDFCILEEDILGILNHLKGKKDFFEVQNYQIEYVLMQKGTEFINEKAEKILNNRDINSIIKELVNIRKFMNDKYRKSLVRVIEGELVGHYSGDDLELFRDAIRRNYSV